MGVISNIKKYIDRNKKIKTLNTRTVVGVENYDSSSKTIIFISRGFPTHDKDSGSNRLKEIIFSFKKLGFNCLIYAEDTFDDNEYVTYYREKGCIVFVENKKFKTVYDWLKSFSAIDYVWYNGANAFIKYFKKMKKKTSTAKHIYDMVDIHFLRFKRAIQIEPNRLSLKKNYKKYFYIETLLSKKADWVIAISEKEKHKMENYIDSSKLVVLSNIHYPKITKEERKDFINSEGILFVGSIHPPNIDAIDFLYKKIMPLVWENCPEIRVTIIGNVVEKLKISNYPKFNFLGYVTEIEEYLKSAKIMIAPLRYGAGVKGKIGQALEYFLPVITTSIGAEGMFLENRENVLISDDYKQIAQYIIELNSDEELWNLLRDNSEESLRPFSLDNVLETIKKL